MDEEEEVFSTCFWDLKGQYVNAELVRAVARDRCFNFKVNSLVEGQLVTYSN